MFLSPIWAEKAKAIMDHLDLNVNTFIQMAYGLR